MRFFFVKWKDVKTCKSQRSRNWDFQVIWNLFFRKIEGHVKKSSQFWPSFRIALWRLPIGIIGLKLCITFKKIFKNYAFSPFFWIFKHSVKALTKKEFMCFWKSAWKCKISYELIAFLFVWEYYWCEFGSVFQIFRSALRDKLRI